MYKCVCVLVLAGLFPASLPADSSFKCGNRIVSLGDSKAEVLVRCGGPDWQDDWTEHLVESLSAAAERRISIAREVWLYDLGPTAFQRILTFENGRLQDIAAGGRGITVTGRPGQDCGFDTLAEGLTQYEVLRRCGRPFFRDSRYEETLLAHDESNRRFINKRVDEWTYNLGPNQFMRILIFESGRLLRVSTGNRGE